MNARARLSLCMELNERKFIIFSFSNKQKSGNECDNDKVYSRCLMNAIQSSIVPHENGMSRTMHRVFNSAYVLKYFVTFPTRSSHVQGANDKQNTAKLNYQSAIWANIN